MATAAAAATAVKSEKKLSKKRRAKEQQKQSSPAPDAIAAPPAKKSKKEKKETGESSKSSPEPTKAPQSAEEFRNEHAIKVTGVSPAPEPWLTFDDATFAPVFKTALRSAGFSAPTPTQCQSWPVVTSGRDLISIAKTGSGKTVAFLVPSMDKLVAAKPTGPRVGRAPRILVLAPTRELACQIEDDGKRFGRAAALSTVCLYGGAPKFPQIRGLQEGCDVLVATPGRLNDLFEMGKVNLGGVQTLVLDEADRMLDMGFEPQIRQIIGELPKARQTLMFTATWPKAVKNLASSFLNDPVTIAMGEQGVLHANKNIKQVISLVDDRDKEERLMKLLAEIGDTGKPYEYPKTIVFCAKKHVVQSLADKLWGQGMAVDCLHGDREQWQRTKVIDAFKTANAREPLRLLIATDVAARGLDVKDVQNVINFDFPGGKGGVEDYVHRIGRTGRAGATGTAYTFFSARNDSMAARELVTVLTRAEQEVPEELSALAQKSSFLGRGGDRKSVV